MIGGYLVTEISYDQSTLSYIKLIIVYNWHGTKLKLFL